MKIKTALLCAVFVGAMMLGGCAAENGGGEEADGTNGTSAQTSNNTSLSEQSGSFADDSADNDADPFSGGNSGSAEAIPDGETTGNAPGSENGDISGDAGDIAPVMNDVADYGKIGWGLGSACDAANRPVDAVNAQEKYGGYNAFFIGDDKNEIYLTFDEGYENGYTAEILDTLGEKNVKAAFFVTLDYCKGSPELVRRMIAEGHTVGNHTVSHPSMPDCSDEQMTAEITELHDYVRNEFGYEMTLFRFPMGEFSEHCLSVVSSLGYKSVFWSFAYSDWDASKQLEPAAAVHKITHATHSGCVFLLHAVSKTNAEILPQLIDFWTDNGYKISPIV